MKLIISVVICLAVFTASIAAASVRVGQHPEGICTRDLNLWGYASRCSCDEGQTYDERSGLCLKGDTPRLITVQGQVSAGVMAIGGETTGYIIEDKNENNSYELILKTADQEKLSKLSGMWFEVEGELITIEGVEVQERTAIIAERVAVLE